MAPITRDDLTDYYDRFGPVVYRRARAMLSDSEEAQDVMQEVFTRVLAHGGDFRGEAEPLHWIYRITTNLCLNRIRQRKAHPVLSDPEAIERLHQGGEPEAVDRAAVLDVLSRVDEEVRRIVVFYYLDEMTMEEVAEMVGRSRKTVGKALERFRKRARFLLDDRGPAR